MSKILVIEDEHDVRENLVELLEVEGYATVSAENGQTGIQKALEHLPDLIICDIQMPKVDGYEVLQTLRQNPATVATPFIFLTARTSHNSQRHGMSLGADDYLTKPFTVDEILDAVTARLQKRMAVDTVYEEKIEELRQSMARSLPHELRTPLTLILGYSSLLLETQSPTELSEVQEMAAGILHAGERMQRLIQKFLLYVELKLNHRREVVRPLGMTKHTLTVAEVITMVGQAASAQAGRSDDLHCQQMGDATVYPAERLSQLLSEILENAFKFSPAGSPVHLCSKADTDGLEIQVVNQGRGMTAEQIAQVGAYVQFDRDQYEQQGLGLGLAIASLAANELGGNLTIESAPEQETRVLVTLPLR